MGSTTGSIIITVKGKEVYVGTAPPSSPVDNELWLDISEDNVLKYYKASDKTWCVVNDVSEKFGDVYKYLQTNYYTKTETNNAVKEEIGKTTIVKKDGTVVNMKDAINSVIDTATEHTQKIENIDSKYNSVAGEIAKVKTSTSEIKQDLNGFKTTVSENYVGKTEFNDLQIGGTNLIRRDYYLSSDSGLTIKYGENGWIDMTGTYTGNSSAFSICDMRNITVTPNKYILSVERASGTNEMVYISVYSNGSINRLVTIPTSGSCVAITIAENETLGFLSISAINGTTYNLKYRFKLEKGNKATDWSPAPEDYETRISSAESKIEQNADSIKHTVKKDGVISAINQSAEEIAIAAKKINLKGYVSVNTDNRKTFEIDTNGNVSLDVNSLKIKAGNIEDSLNDLNDSISSANDYANERVNELDEKISSELSNNYVNGDTFNKFKEQLSYQQNITNEGLEERFTSIDNRINNSLTGTNEKVELITKYIRHKDGKLILGEEGSALVTTIENGMISFTENIDSDNPQKVAYISNRKLYITDAEVHLNMILGDPDKSQFAFVPDSNGNLSFMKIS